MNTEKQIQAQTLSFSNGVERIDELNEQSGAMHFQSPRQSLKLAQEAYALSEQAEYPKGIAYSMLNQGIAYWVLGELNEAKKHLLETVKKMVEISDELGEAKAINWLGNTHERLGNAIEAFNCHLRALELREKNGDREGMGASFNNIGNLYLRLEDYPTALSYYYKALEIRQQIGDEEGQAATNANIGIIFYRLGKYEEARNYGLRAIEQFRRCKNLQGYANALNNLGLVYDRLGEEDKAVQFYNECREIYSGMSDKQGEANALNNLGLLLVKKGKHRDALAYYEKSLELTHKVGDKLFEAETLLNIGICYKESQQEESTQKALDYLLKVHEVAIELRSKKYLAEACKALSEIFEAKGDLAQALTYFKMFQQAHAQMLEESSEERLQVVVTRNELQKAMQAAEIYRLKNIELAKANERLAEANASLKEANQLKSEFLAIAAHDLKNPLTAILDLVQNILVASDRSQQERMLYLISEFVERMLGIIEKVVEMSRIESGKITLNCKEVDVGQLAMLMVASYEHRAAKKSIQIIEEIEDGAVAFVDEDRLREVFDNLLSNAIKYSYPKKRVWLSVKRLERGTKIQASPVVQIRVSDEGQGFSEEEKLRLFQRFQRLSAKPTAGESSTGLGLSIARQLVELHGGAIWAHSDGKNKGATFTVELPSRIE